VQAVVGLIGHVCAQWYGERLDRIRIKSR
jgi:hypothetical protein